MVPWGNDWRCIMAAEEGNKFLREMTWNRARELCRIELRQHPEQEAAYLKWCDDNREQIETMNAGYRGIGLHFIHSKVNN
jgi:hypothetical protein